MKVYGDQKTEEIILLIDGDYVVNGDWYATFSEDGKQAWCASSPTRSPNRGHGDPIGSKDGRAVYDNVAHFIADVPQSILGKFKRHDYNGIMEATRKYLLRRKK